MNLLHFVLMMAAPGLMFPTGRVVAHRPADVPRAKLEFRLARESTFSNAERVTAPDLPTIYVAPHVLVSTNDIVAVAVGQGRPGFNIYLSLTAAAAHRLKQATSSHIGQRIAIFIDGRLFQAPVINAATDDPGFRGGTTRDAATSLAERLAP